MNGRPWKFALIASFVLNVFLLGGIAGGAYQWFNVRGQTVAAPPAQPRPLRFAAADLSVERQVQFVAALKAARREGRELAVEGREERREVLRILSAPQLDRVALDSALARTRQADSALRARVEESVADFAASLTPDERVKFVDGLRQSGQWRVPAQPAQQQTPQQQTPQQQTPQQTQPSQQE